MLIFMFENSHHSSFPVIKPNDLYHRELVDFQELLACLESRVTG